VGPRTSCVGPPAKKNGIIKHEFVRKNLKNSDFYQDAPHLSPPTHEVRGGRMGRGIFLSGSLNIEKPVMGFYN